jgi:signal transduction histidine kinase
LEKLAIIKLVKKAMPTDISDTASRTRWSVFLHWYMLAALGVSGLFAIFIAEGFSERFFINLGLLGVFILSNFIFYFLARLRRGDVYYRSIILAIVIYELLFITLAMYLNGGLESQIFILYVVPILMSAVTLQGYWVYLTALVTVSLIGGFLWADYMGWITSLDKLTGLSKDYQYVLNTIVFIGLVVLLITYLANYMIHLLQQKERQALASAEALARAQAVAQLGSWEWDIPNGTISWSDQLYKMFGMRPGSKITYDAYLEKIHPDDRSLMTRTIERSLKTGRSYKIDHRIVGGSNKIRTIRGEGRIIKNAAGEPVKMIGTARDITSEQELEQAKSNFVSLASHQLRTPATEVKMLLALLKDGYVGELTGKQSDMVAKAYRVNERQMKIANDLLGVARIDAGKIKLRKQSLELGQWLGDIVQDIRPVLQDKKQQLVFKPLKKSVVVRADPERLHLVIENLIDNASKYTPAGGKVTLRYSAGASQAVISVRDTGVGIAKSNQQKMFEIYTRIDNRLSPQVGGSGLGLYLVKKLVDLHRGRVEVHSRLGRGSTFRIHLPY